MNTGRLVWWFDELGQEDNELGGKKCANLGVLTRAGFQVPPGFALSLEAYERFLTDTGAIEEIRQYFAAFDADPDNPKDLPKFQEASRIVRGFVESKAMPENMERTVAQYYDELCQKTGIKDVPVATRSAGTASHPGQYETYLHVRGKPDVMKNIIKRLISAFDFAVAEALGRYKVKASLIAQVRFKQLIGKMPEVKDYHEFYLLLKKIDKAKYSAREEYRKNVTLVLSDLEVNVDILKEYFEKTKEFVELVS